MEKISQIQRKWRFELNLGHLNQWLKIFNLRLNCDLSYRRKKSVFPTIEKN